MSLNSTILYYDNNNNLSELMKTRIQLLILVFSISTSIQKGIKCSQLINNEAFYELEFL